MILNQNLLKEIGELIKKTHLFFCIKVVGIDKKSLSNEDIKIIEDNKIESSSVGVIEQSYYFGKLNAILGNDNTKEITYNDFLKYIKEGQFLELTKQEQLSLEAIKYQAYSDIKKLENTIFSNIEEINIKNSKDVRSKYEEIIQLSLEDNIKNRKNKAKLISDIGHKTGDWERNINKMASFLIQSCYDLGKANVYSAEYGEDSLVYKEVYKGACKYCIKLYLTDGEGSKPRFFKISEIRANGDNIGRKPNEWRAVIGSTHVHCRCTLNFINNEIFDWNPKTGNFTEIKSWKRKVERKSKVYIKVGTKSFIR